MGVSRQGRQALEVQGEFHVALVGEAAFDLRLFGQEVRLRRVGEEIRVIALQGLAEQIQILLPFGRGQSRRVRRQGGGAQRQGRGQSQAACPAEKLR